MSTLIFIRDFLFNPKIAFFIFVMFILGYLILLDEEGAFRNKFLNFGPSEDTKYLTMTLNTWPKVITVYTIAFLAAFLSTYYNNVSHNFIHDYLWNPAYTERMPITKWFTTMIVTIEPLLYWILSVFTFFINLTFELQYIIFRIVGNLLVNIPYGLYKVNQKKYVS